MQGWRDNMEDSTPTPFITDMAESGNGPKPVGLVDAQSVGQVATAPQVQAAPVFAGQHQESSPVTNVLPAVFEKGPLLQNVRGLLRGNLENKQKWCAFCQMHGTTNFRPEVQDEAFLLTFMDALQSGGIPEFEGTVPPELQEASDWKGCGKAGGKAGDAWGGKSAMGGDAWGGKGAKENCQLETLARSPPSTHGRRSSHGQVLDRTSERIITLLITTNQQSHIEIHR